MPARDKGGRYHHGDLRAALIDAAVEVIGERGVRGFSMAEASRRLGVAPSAPYAHFADRDDLLAAVTVHAYALLHAALVPGLSQQGTPAEQLAEMARRYIRFAAAHRSLFDLLYYAGQDKTRYPEIAAAERLVDDAFMARVRALSVDERSAGELAAALEATASGHVVLLFDGTDGPGERGVASAAERAARATLALIEGRGTLTAADGRGPVSC